MLFVNRKGEIAVISKLLLGIDNAVLLKLVKLIELSESSDENVLESL